MNIHPLLRLNLLVALAIFPGSGADAADEEGAVTETQPGRRPTFFRSEIRAAIVKDLPKYQTPAPSDSVEVTVSDEAATEKNGVLNLPKMTVQTKGLSDLSEYDLLTVKGRLELAMKRHPGLRIGNIFGMNNGIALAMLQEEVDVEKRNALKTTVEGVSRYDSPGAHELKRLLQDAIARPNTEWLNGRPGQ